MIRFTRPFRLYKLLRSPKIALLSILIIILYLAVSSLSGEGLSGGRDAFFSPLFLIPLGIFFINLMSCTIYRIYLEVSGRRRLSPGPDLIHLSLILAALAGMVSLFGRWEGEVFLSPGEAVRLDENFILLLEDFQISRYDEGGVKQWLSILLALDREGKPVKRMEVKVNSPGSFRGYRFYQSSWQEAEGQLYSGLMAVRDPSIPYAAAAALLMMAGLMLTYLRKGG